MRIVYCIAGTYNSGGMERVLANKANYWVEKGHEVHIITTDQRKQQPFFPLDERIVCHDLDINYEENNGKSFLNKVVNFPLKQWRHKRRLTKLLKELKADVVISMFCNEVDLLPAIKDGSKKVLEVHFSRFKRLQYGRKGLWRWADRWRWKKEAEVAARYDRFVVLTQEDLDYWGDIPYIRAIPNARTFTQEAPADLDEKVVLAAGRYNFQKGFDRLIEAWALVCKQNKDWKLRIVGDGELREAYIRQIKELKLEDRILLGRAETDMKAVYRQVSIFALSSHYEGLPMVLLEAQASGLPIVSFTCKCGPKDVVADGETGFLVPEGEVELLAEKLLCLMQDEALRKEMGKRAFLNSELYSTEKVMKQWEYLLLDLMA